MTTSKQFEAGFSKEEMYLLDEDKLQNVAIAELLDRVQALEASSTKAAPVNKRVTWQKSNDGMQASIAKRFVQIWPDGSFISSACAFADIYFRTSITANNASMPERFAAAEHWLLTGEVIVPSKKDLK